MSTINPQIDAAVVLMKKRAAKFNNKREMGREDLAYPLSVRALKNLNNAVGEMESGDITVIMAAFDSGPDAEAEAVCARVRRDLLDTMNLCALALSVLPKEGSDEPA